jgi:hypothetical protein
VLLCSTVTVCFVAVRGPTNEHPLLLTPVPLFPLLMSQFGGPEGTPS